MLRASQLTFPADQVEQALAMVENLCAVCENVLGPDCKNCAVHTAKRALASLSVYEVPKATKKGGGCGSGGCGR